MHVFRVRASDNSGLSEPEEVGENNLPPDEGQP